MQATTGSQAAVDQHLSQKLMMTVKELASIDAQTAQSLEQKLKSDSVKESQNKSETKTKSQKSQNQTDLNLFKKPISQSAVQIPNYTGPLMLAQTGSSQSQTESQN